MADLTPQWNPSEILKIEDTLTCSGWAHSKGRRCCNQIARKNRDLATKIMEDMALLDVRTTDFDTLLTSLTKRLLCRTYHVKDPNQHTALRRQWGKDIAAYKVTLIARQTPAATVPESTPGTVESLQRELEAMRAAMALLLQRTAEPAEVEHSPSIAYSNLAPQTNHVHQATSPLSAGQTAQTQANTSQHLHPVAGHQTVNIVINTANTLPPNGTTGENHLQIQLPPTFPSPSQSTDAVSPPPQPSLIPTLPASTTHNDTLPTTHQPTPLPSPTQTHQHPLPTRKPISGPCTICCEDLRTEENISWCKAQCGQNFHADCVGVWLATLDEGQGTCPFW